MGNFMYDSVIQNSIGNLNPTARNCQVLAETLHSFSAAANGVKETLQGDKSSAIWEIKEKAAICRLHERKKYFFYVLQCQNYDSVSIFHIICIYQGRKVLLYLHLVQIKQSFQVYHFLFNCSAATKSNLHLLSFQYRKQQPNLRRERSLMNGVKDSCNFYQLIR